MIVMDHEIQEYWEGTECTSWEYKNEGMSHVISSHSERVILTGQGYDY